MRARDNPFATDRVLRIRYALSDNDWAALLARLTALRHRAAIVGPHGTGKTTLLEDIRDRLEARGVPTLWLRLDAEHRTLARTELNAHLAQMTAASVICLDGAEQLPRWAWLAFKRRTRSARGLIITSHRSGLLPTLHTCTTNATLLAEILSRLAPDAPSNPTTPSSQELFARHHGNLRDALREMYDRYAAH